MEIQLYSFSISALEGGGWSASSPGRFTLGIETRYSLYRRLVGWASGWVWTGEENLASAFSPYGVALRLRYSGLIGDTFLFFLTFKWFACWVSNTVFWKWLVISRKKQMPRSHITRTTSELSANCILSVPLVTDTRCAQSKVRPHKSSCSATAHHTQLVNLKSFSKSCTNRRQLDI